MWYSYEDAPETYIPLTIEKVKEIMEMNAQGIKPADIQGHQILEQPKEELPDYENVVGQDSITRFDDKSIYNKAKKNNQQGAKGNSKQKRRKPQSGNNNSKRKNGDSK
jgi:hypothetical protein